MNLKVGDEIVVHYTTFYDGSYELKSGLVLNNEKVWTITYDDVFAVVRDGDLCPVGEFVLGREVKVKTLSSSFLILPDGVGEEVDERVSVVYKPSVKNTLQLSTGDKVYLLKWANYIIDHNGEKYLRFRESEVVALC